MVNNTLNYLMARAPLCVLGFSGAMGTTSAFLNGPGGQAGDGFPLPRNGTLTGLRLWDGATDHADHAEVPLEAGDRVSVYCQNVGGSFTVKVRLNGTTTALQVAGVPLSSTLFATVEFVSFRME